MSHEYSNAPYKLAHSKKPKKMTKQTGIVLMREQNYEHVFFEKGEVVLEGLNFPLGSNTFKLKKNISALPPWRDVLSAYGLDTRNLSYPKRNDQ